MKIMARLGYQELHSERNVAKLSIVGAGMMSNPGVAAKMFESLYNEGVNINMISTSEIRVTVLINEKDGIRAMSGIMTHLTWQINRNKRNSISVASGMEFLLSFNLESRNQG